MYRFRIDRTCSTAEIRFAENKGDAADAAHCFAELFSVGKLVQCNNDLENELLECALTSSTERWRDCCCLKKSEDYEAFDRVLAEAVTRIPLPIFSYCLITA